MKKVLIIVGVIAIAFIGFYWYIGGFESLEVKKKRMGGYLVAGLNYTGPYHMVGPTMEKADSTLRSMGINCTKGFGIYYDNPETTPENQLRSYVGNVIESADAALIEEMQLQGLRVDSISEKESLVAEMTTRSTLSYMIGPMKAYPLLTEAIKANTCVPTMSYELYDVPAQKTYYVMQCDF